MNNNGTPLKKNAVIGALLESWKNFQFKFNLTSEPFQSDKLNTSDIREITVKEFLEMCFPTPYRVAKGQIYDISKSSNNIDCVLLAPNHPRLITPLRRDVILADGVYSAIEVKPDIQNSAEFSRGLEQIKSVKLLNREVTRIQILEDIPAEFKQIPCVIFANKSKNEWRDTVGQMCDFVSERNIASSLLPDIVVALDKGIIFHSTHIEKTIYASWAYPSVGDAFIYLECLEEQLLGMLLLTMLTFTPPEPPIADPIIKRYLLSMSGLTQAVKYSVFPFMQEHADE